MKRACLEPRCPSPASYRGRCQAHARQQDKAINRVGRSIYNTKRWKVLRLAKLNLTPFCEEQGCESMATDVHHKHGVEQDPWSMEGLEALCHAHHSQRTRREQAA